MRSNCKPRIKMCRLKNGNLITEKQENLNVTIYYVNNTTYINQQLLKFKILAKILTFRIC
jgi:hypothetical protein